MRTIYAEQHTGCSLRAQAILFNGLLYKLYYRLKQHKRAGGGYTENRRAGNGINLTILLQSKSGSDETA